MDTERRPEILHTEDTYVLPLPDGSQSPPLTREESLILEGLLCVSEEKPATKSELAIFVYGDQIPVEETTQKLSQDLPRLGEKLSNTSWVVAERSEPNKEILYYLNKAERTKTTPSQAVIPQDVVMLAEKVLELIPLSNTPHLKEQATEFVLFALDVIDGRISLTTPAAIVRTPYSKKPEIAVRRVRELLSSLVNSQIQIYRFRNKWARDMRELLDWLGENSTEHLRQAVDDLPELERDLFISSSSIALLEDLDFLDIDKCDESRFAKYLTGAAFDPEHMRDMNFDYLLVNAIDRSIAGTLDLELVIQVIYQIPYHEHIFRRLIESAQRMDLETHLAVFFMSHPATRRLAISIQEQPLDIPQSVLFDLSDQDNQ